MVGALKKAWHKLGFVVYIKSVANAELLLHTEWVKLLLCPAGEGTLMLQSCMNGSGKVLICLLTLLQKSCYFMCI